MNTNILIAYFSHEGEAYVSGKIVKLEEGNTKVTASMLEEMTGGNVFRIKPVTPYPYSYMETIDIAKKEQQQDARPAFQGKVDDMEQYDTIILAYPNWWGTMPQIVMTFLESYDFKGKTILPLCTNEGSGMGHSEADIKKLCPEATLQDGLAVIGGQVKQAKPVLEKWMKRNRLI